MMTMTLKATVDYSDLVQFVDEFEITLVPRFIEQIAISIFREISREAPVVTGRLAGSVQFPEQITPVEFQIEINAEYWEYVQFGTGIHGPLNKPYPIFPKRKRALAFVVDGEMVIVKYVKAHPGRKPDPFVDRAIDTVEGKMDDIADAIIGTAA